LIQCGIYIWHTWIYNYNGIWQSSNIYHPQLGIILVHDLTNRKSQQNLQKWLEEVLSRDGTSSKSKTFDDFDPEKFVGSTQVIKIFQTIISIYLTKQMWY